MNIQNEREARAEKRQRLGYDDGGPTQAKQVVELDQTHVVLATRFMMQEIADELDYFVRHFDPKRDKAMKDAVKAQRAKKRELEKAQRAQQQSAQETFEQNRLRQQMAFQQSQMSPTAMSPNLSNETFSVSGAIGIEGAWPGCTIHCCIKSSCAADWTLCRT